MNNFIVNVLITSQSHVQEVMPGGGLTLLQFGPCTESEGQELADEINRWGRGGEGMGPIGLQELILNFPVPIIDVWASCYRIQSSTSVSELLRRLQHLR
jgi:hypothetical protein